MRIAFWNRYPELSTDNYCFTHRDAPIGDDLLLPFVHLAEAARAHGHECVTLDLVPRRDSDDGPRSRFEGLDAIVFIDAPDTRIPMVRAALASGLPLYLITFENALILPENWVGHERFKRVFTWHDGLVASGGRYVKLNYAQEFPQELPRTPKRKLCAMIASNKQSAHPDSLYPRRVAAVRWFERWHPFDFDLYGYGWADFPSWRGPVRSKREVLQHYSFSICFENAEAPGYITEKIFDSMIAGCVPVYLGAPNVADHLGTHDCFIDGHLADPKYGGYGALYDLLTSINPVGYAARRHATEHFFRSPQARPFTTQAFAKTILDTLEQDLGVLR